MSKAITLIKASVVPGHGGALRPSGFTAEVDEATYQGLLRRGVITAEPAPAPPSTAEEEEVSAPEPEVEEEPEPAPAPPTKSGGKLPPMTAPIAVWREFAESPAVGIKTAGMKKPEIIGAVKHHLGK